MAEEIEYAVVESTKKPGGEWLNTTEYFKSRSAARKRQADLIRIYSQIGVIGHRMAKYENAFGVGNYVGVMFAYDSETFPQHTLFTIGLYEKPTRSYP